MSGPEKSQLVTAEDPQVATLEEGSQVSTNDDDDDDDDNYSTDACSDDEEPGDESLLVSNARTSMDKFVFSYNTDNDRAGSMTIAEEKLYNLDSRAFVERGKTIGTEILRILTDSHGLSEAAKEQLAALFKEAANLAEFEQKSEVKICFLGDQGAGKFVPFLLSCLY